MTSRPLDVLYEASFILSSRKDFLKEQCNKAYFQLEHIPNYRNFFSSLVHHPNTIPRHLSTSCSYFQHRLSRAGLSRVRTNSAFAASIESSCNLDRTATQKPTVRKQVDGGKLWNHFFASSPSCSLEKNKTPLSELRLSVRCLQCVRRIGTNNQVEVKKEFTTASIQTDYRDASTQTDPTALKVSTESSSTLGKSYTYSYLKKDADLLKDTDERNCTVEFLERLRNERDFEKSLPPIGTEGALIKRQKMIAIRKQEMWKDKETTMKKSQQKALQRFKINLHRKEDLLNEKIEARTAQRYQQQTGNPSCRRKSHPGLTDPETTRWLTKSLPTKTKNIDAFADVCSALYLPLQRDGGAAKKPVDINDSRMQDTVEALDQIEEKLSMEWCLQAPQDVSKKTDRMEVQLEKDLTVISDAIQSSAREGSRGEGSCWIAPTTSTALRKPAHTPPRGPLQPISTSTMCCAESRELIEEKTVVRSEDNEQLTAVEALRRVIRGRLLQDYMIGEEQVCSS